MATVTAAAVAPVKPIILKDMVITIGTDDFAAAISSATLTPAASIVTWKGLKTTAVYSFPTSPTWTLDLEYAQDWKTANSLSRYLFDHDGQTIVGVTLEPTSGVGTRWTFDLIVVPGAIGGAVDAVGTASVSLGVAAKPVPSTLP